MSTVAPIGSWSSTVSLTAGARYRYTATPGAGGSVRMQWTDGTNWYDFGNSAIGAVVTSLIPAAATGIRGQGIGAAGSFDTVNADPLYPSYLGEVADQAAMIALTGVIIGQQVKRTDTDSNWQLDAQPPSTASNWRNIGNSEGGGVTASYTEAQIQAAIIADTLLEGLYVPSDNAQVLYWYDGTTLRTIGYDEAVRIPQFAAKQSIADFTPIPFSATGLIASGPLIFGWIRCITAGTIDSVRDNTTASGTVLITSKVMAAGDEFGLLDDVDHNDAQGVLFNLGLYIAMTGGTYEVYVRPATGFDDTTYGPVTSWNKYEVSGDGSPSGLAAPCTLRSILCLTNGTVQVGDGAGVIGTSIYPATALTANGKVRFGKRGGRKQSSGVFVDITGGTYLVMARPGV